MNAEELIAVPAALRRMADEAEQALAGLTAARVAALEAQLAEKTAALQRADDLLRELRRQMRSMERQLGVDDDQLGLRLDTEADGWELYDKNTDARVAPSDPERWFDSRVAAQDPARRASPAPTVSRVPDPRRPGPGRAGSEHPVRAGGDQPRPRRRAGRHHRR